MATRWGAFCASGSRYALELQSEWGRLLRARKGAITAAGLATPPIETVLDASASAFGHKAVKLHRTTLNEIRSNRGLEVQARAFKLPCDDPRRRASLGSAEDKASLQFFTGTPMPRRSYTAQEFHSSAQSALELPQSSRKPISGRPITNNANCPTARVGAYGHFFKKP